MPQALRVVVVLGVLSLIVAVTHAYIYRRLVRDVVDHPAHRRLGRWAIILAGVAMVAGAAGSRVLPRDLGQIVAYLAYGWMGMVVLLMPILAIVDLVRAVVVRADRRPTDPGRRQALARAAAAVTALTSTAAGAVGVQTALSAPELHTFDLPIPDLPPALVGFRIAQLSDIHIGPLLGGDFARSLVERVNALDVDLVALTGDLVDGSVAHLGAHVAPFGELRSRHGTFFVTGNHEYYSGADAWIAELRRLGIRVLRNERVAVEHDGATLDVLGVDDWRSKGFGGGHGHDLVRACADRDPRRPSLLLAHQPKVVDEAAEQCIDAVLCGHTHGGQMWPFGLIVALQQPYVVGLHHHRERTWIYVHPGTGYWGPPMRLKVNAQIAVATLVAASPLTAKA